MRQLLRGQDVQNPRPPDLTKPVVTTSALTVLVPPAFTLRVRSDYRYGGATYTIRGDATFNNETSKTVKKATLTFMRCADQSAGKKCKP
jgi:hypothetical protein